MGVSASNSARIKESSGKTLLECFYTAFPKNSCVFTSSEGFRMLPQGAVHGRHTTNHLPGWASQAGAPGQPPPGHRTAVVVTTTASPRPGPSADRL